MDVTSEELEYMMVGTHKVSACKRVVMPEAITSPRVSGSALASTVSDSPANGR